ncbi:MAG: ATP-dependent helicase HrpB [Deltaproteobacteria bacterium]|nr:ATP-dependent helicase HrpB [Deltaproteobacteria bacterium]
MRRALPIDALLGEAVEVLRQGSRLVLRAAPGSGKTTRVPAALLDAGVAGGKQVLVLEPRRIAAAAAAEFVSRERGQSLGNEVGYRVRFEQRGGSATRLWFLTEGVLSRQLTRDPFLEEAGVIVLDEFHERHLQGDVALAMIAELQETVRSDLKLVIMSATLETDRLAAHLGGCPVLTAEGRSYPVKIEYLGELRQPLHVQICAAVQRVLADPGDILVFLPGANEIRRSAAALASLAQGAGFDVLSLHGDLPLEAQRRVLEPGPRHKVILSTNVAETSLTIEGVTTVIDSGLAREARFDLRHGINSLRVVRISQASAAQRAGRAGRLAPGRCLRLGEEAEYRSRRAHDTPEILRLDLCATLLELRAWGARQPKSMRWLDAPSAAALDRAEQSLQLLGAIDPQTSAITEIGQRMLEMPIHPRLCRLLLEAERRGCGHDGALLAALASEKDILLEQRGLSQASGARWPDGLSDLLLRLELFREAAQRSFDASVCARLGLDARTVRSVDRVRRQLLRHVGGHDAAGDDVALLKCILAGFPDRVVKRQVPRGARGAMVGGRGVLLAESSVVREADLFVAVEVGAGERRGAVETTVRLASAIELSWLSELEAQAMYKDVALEFDGGGERVVERRRTRYADLILSEQSTTNVDAQRAGVVLAEAARADPWHAAQPGVEVGALLDRLRFLRAAMPEIGLPEDPQTLLTEAVVASCAGRKSFAELRRADLLSVMRALLPRPQLAALEREAPAHYGLPTGRAVPIRYASSKPPMVAARIQELFGLRMTPRLAGNRVALVLELLAPNQRPVQITDDLQSFWSHTYPEVRKVLRGRYPKHEWPEDPLSARPTARAKRAQR